MKTPLPSLVLSFLAGAFLTSSAQAAPIDFKEVSLLVRAHDQESFIVQEVAQRKLLRALTPAEEAKIRSQGASESLLRALRDSSVVLPAQEAAAFEQERALRSKMPVPANRMSDTAASDQSAGQFQVFDVSFGHPVNLSEWGGPDYEFAFQCRRFAGEDIIEPFLTDSSRNYIDTATYLGAGRREDNTTIFDNRDYVSVMAYSAARPMQIDMHNPVAAKGVPYVMYPVYGAGGVSLYYIGKTGGSVRLAIKTAAR